MMEKKNGSKEIKISNTKDLTREDGSGRIKAVSDTLRPPERPPKPESKGKEK